MNPFIYGTIDTCGDLGSDLVGQVRGVAKTLIPANSSARLDTSKDHATNHNYRLVGVDSK